MPEARLARTRRNQPEVNEPKSWFPRHGLVAGERIRIAVSRYVVNPDPSLNAPEEPTADAPWAV
jgi:hypothetical protein